MNRCRVQLVVGAVGLLLDGPECHWDEVVEFYETGEEESAESLHRVVGGGVCDGDDEVSMATVPLDQREEDGDPLVPEVRVHEPGDEATVGIHGDLPRV